MRQLALTFGIITALTGCGLFGGDTVVNECGVGVTVTFDSVQLVCAKGATCSVSVNGDPVGSNYVLGSALPAKHGDQVVIACIPDGCGSTLRVP